MIAAFLAEVIETVVFGASLLLVFIRLTTRSDIVTQQPTIK